MTPKLPRPSRAEEMALFRHSVVGDLLTRELDRGELQDELKSKAARRYRPPGAPASRPFHWKTLQTWYYDARDGLDGLTPASRARGHALALDDGQRELLLDMRREHRSAATELILTEAVRNGAIPKEAVSEATLRRLYRDHDLGRDSQNRASRRERRRWQADRPCAIWHADVCHVWLRDAAGKCWSTTSGSPPPASRASPCAVPETSTRGATRTCSCSGTTAGSCCTPSTGRTPPRRRSPSS